jgi:hypothetical protein
LHREKSGNPVFDSLLRTFGLTPALNRSSKWQMKPIPPASIFANGQSAVQLIRHFFFQFRKRLRFPA